MIVIMIKLIIIIISKMVGSGRVSNRYNMFVCLW